MATPYFEEVQILRDNRWIIVLIMAVSLAALLGIFGILAHSFVDFNLQIPANAALFYALCGIAAMDARFRNPRREYRRRALAEDAINPQI